MVSLVCESIDLGYSFIHIHLEIEILNRYSSKFLLDYCCRFILRGTRGTDFEGSIIGSISLQTHGNSPVTMDLNFT